MAAGKISLIIVFTIVHLFLLVNCSKKPKAGDPDPKSLLPKTFLPINYDVFLYTNIKTPDFKFTGKVVIQMTCIKDTSELVLHMMNLTIDHNAVNYKCVNSTGNGTKAKSNKYDKDLQMYSVTFEEPFKANQVYEVYIPYEGELSEYQMGIYRNSYTDKNNKTSWFATTEFALDNARYAFPCFDEPNYKATFSINIGHPKDLNVISNMPLENSGPVSNKTNWALDTFKKSPKMSTYMVGFHISDFTNKKCESGSVPFQIWTYKDQMNQTDLAADVGPKCLPFLETYFKSKFPLPKVDLIAVPGIYADNEYWGMIKFSESDLLLDKEHSSVTTEYYNMLGIPKMLAFMWWGDLVTFKSWTDLWFFGSLPRYVAPLALDTIFKSGQAPEWTFLREYTYKQTSWCLNQDSKSAAQPLNIKADNLTKFYSLFDDNAYDKGAALMMMLSMSLTDKVFQEGVQKYVELYSFGNADHDDFWNVLTKVAQQSKTLPAGLTVNTIMDAWTNKAGFPILEVKREDSVLRFTQKRYVSDKLGNNTDNTAGSWWIPLYFVGPKSDSIFNSSQPIWLAGDSKISFDSKTVISNGQLDVGNSLDKSDWFLVNKEMCVPMHINYDDQTWDLIIAQLKKDHTKIPVMNRVQLILDVNTFSGHNLMPFGKAFDLLSYVLKEDDIVPWRATLEFLWVDVDYYMMRTEKCEQFKAWARQLIGPMYHRLASSPKPNPGNYGLRILSVHMNIAAAAFELPEQEEKMKSEFDNWKKSPATYFVHPDIGFSPFCIHIRKGTRSDWDELYNLYPTCTSVDVQQMLRAALACTKDPEILTHYLKVAHMGNDSKIATEDASAVFTSVIDQPMGFKPAKDFLFNNTDKIYNLSKYSFPAYVKYLYKYVMTDAELKEIQDYAAKNDKYLKDYKEYLKKYEDVAKQNIIWQKENYKEIADYLTANVKQ
uniref:Aminopeptidase n=1 Tax=Cacopsylla melanoneura TaxID=428564 RepID=A0A8D8PR26_9HEMI